jgi:hypothetical protein
MERHIPGLVVFLLLAAAAAQQFEVVPDTVGIGLQKNFDIVDVDSGEDPCVLYHLGNPWAANVTGWIEVSGNISQFFTGNEPEEVFVPSGTFRYNSSCCLLPIRACFDMPNTLEDRRFTGKVFSAFRTGSSRGPSGTGSATGSSVAYTLTLHVRPLRAVELSAGQTKCFEFYGGQEACLSAPWVVWSDTSEDVEIDGHTVTVHYANNKTVLTVLAVLLVAAAAYNYRRELRGILVKEK